MPNKKRKITVKLSFRKGEYDNTVARFEFSHPAYIAAVLGTTKPAEQKKYNFHFFNSILVAKNYDSTLKDFIRLSGEKIGLIVTFAEREAEIAK